MVWKCWIRQSRTTAISVMQVQRLLKSFSSKKKTAEYLTWTKTYTSIKNKKITKKILRISNLFIINLFYWHVDVQLLFLTCIIVLVQDLWLTLELWPADRKQICLVVSWKIYFQNEFLKGGLERRVYHCRVDA